MGPCNITISAAAYTSRNGTSGAKLAVWAVQWVAIPRLSRWRGHGL